MQSSTAGTQSPPPVPEFPKLRSYIKDTHTPPFPLLQRTVAEPVPLKFELTRLVSSERNSTTFLSLQRSFRIDLSTSNRRSAFSDSSLEPFYRRSTGHLYLKRGVVLPERYPIPSSNARWSRVTAIADTPPFPELSECRGTVSIDIELIDSSGNDGPGRHTPPVSSVLDRVGSRSGYENTRNRVTGIK